MTIDIKAIRDEFPILNTKVYGHDLVYFDNAATTQKPRRVVEKIVENYYTENANVHRGVHFLSQKATDAHEAARDTVRQFLNARKSHEIIFTRGTTESINLVASSFGREFLQPGDEVIVSRMEHHSNIVPWQLIPGVKVRPLPFDAKGNLQVKLLETMINEKTRLVSVAHVSNTLGTINPIKQIIDIAHSYGIPVLIDGAQGVPHTKVDVQELDADFYAFSGHKIYGPTGIGVLYGKEEWLDRLPPYQGGGDMINRVSFEKTTFAALPFKFEAGTPDFIGSTALAEALRFVETVGIENIAQHEAELVDYATKTLTAEIPNFKVYGQSEQKSSVVSFNIEGIHPYDIGSILDKLGIAIRTGHHCAQPVMQAFEVEGMARASFAVYNTKEEIDVLVEGLKRTAKMFGRRAR